MELSAGSTVRKGDRHKHLFGTPGKGDACRDGMLSGAERAPALDLDRGAPVLALIEALNGRKEEGWRL